MIDRTKVGIAMANVMDRLEKFEELDEISKESEIAEVLVIVVMNRPSPTELEPDRVESQIFLDGTTQLVYTQLGILEFAKDTCGSGELDD
jgi:hypothetical protein